MSIHIADDIRQPILDAIRDAHMFSVLFDGATDKSVTEVEVIYIRLLSQGQPKTFFLSLQPVEHAHAQGVYEAVERAFIANGIENWREKLVGIGCDGANVNIGQKKLSMDFWM